MKMILQKLMQIQRLNLAVNKDSKNPFFKSSYVSLDNLVSTLAPHLNERGLLVYHYSDNHSVITVVADTETAETVMSSFPMIESNDPQKLGSCISYAKRYNLGQLFNIITDRDDDANTASDKVVKENAAPTEGGTVHCCSVCGNGVNDAVAKYSKDKFGAVKCMQCQKK